ncbi:hypothetical protein [Soonwooa sp.]|uniref:hypothetical protein n=1 Tax=Soonwooa sp. TaxID=1938592 RepID=UPI0028AAB0FD|nr:hypothetical protein [Soonwooa sp.]
MKYLRIKSNDGSAFKFNSIYLKPDTNLYATFKGFLKGVEVATANLSFRNPERWSSFSVEEYPTFGNFDEIRIILNVTTYFVGIDSIDISAQFLSTTEIKKTPILVVSKNNELIINSTLETKIKIYNSTGKLIMNQNLQIGKKPLKQNTFQKECISYTT